MRSSLCQCVRARLLRLLLRCYVYLRIFTTASCVSLDRSRTLIRLWPPPRHIIRWWVHLRVVVSRIGLPWYSCHLWQLHFFSRRYVTRQQEIVPWDTAAGPISSEWWKRRVFHHHHLHNYVDMKHWRKLHQVDMSRIPYVVGTRLFISRDNND